jgi:DNA-directed RNA polymerase specialized sigma24 family protein
MDEKQVHELMTTLDTIKRLLAHQAAQVHETLETKAAVLASLGLKPKEIAVICGTTPGTVSARLAEAKKKAQRKKG